MHGKKRSQVHWSFWVIGIITLIWNIMGAINFVVQMSPDMVASMPETHRAIIEVRPAWATAAFALAVFGGVLGCFLLLIQKSASFYVFIASLLGIIITMIPHIDMVGTVITDPFEIIMMIILPVVVAAFLIWYSKLAERHHWIQ